MFNFLVSAALRNRLLVLAVAATLVGQVSVTLGGPRTVMPMGTESAVAPRLSVALAVRT